MKHRLIAPSLATFTMAPADIARGGRSAPVAEIVTFRLIDGVGDAAFLDAARATEPFVRAAPGFVSRRLSKDASGTWTDHIEWRSLAEAEAAAASIMAEPGVAPFLSAIDGETVTMRHERLLLQME